MRDVSAVRSTAVLGTATARTRRISWITGPEGSELCLDNGKPEESLLEARNGSGVRIGAEIWI